MKKLLALAVLALVLVLVWRAWPSIATRSAAPQVRETANAAPEPVAPPAEPSEIREEPAATRTQVADPAPTPTPTAPAAPSEPKASIRLVDERTGEPVPRFELELQPAGGETAIATSDAEGRIELPARADTTLLLRENENGSDRIQIRSAAVASIPRRVSVARDELGENALDVRIPVGPTYRLSFGMPAGHRSLVDLTATLRGADPRSAFDRADATPRDEREPWVRFRPTALLVSGGPPWRLELATRDGLWFGAAEVASIEGVHPNAVEITLESRASVQGYLVDDEQKPLEREYVRLERDGASFVGIDNRPAFGLTDAKGFFQIPCLPPGNYRVKCSVEKHRDIERSIELTAGIVSELQLVAERLAEQELVHVEGLVESDTGGYRGRLYALALPERTRKVVRSDVTWATVSGRAVGSFAFDLAPGEHSISLSGNRLLEVEPREVAWAAAGAPLEFRVHDAVELGRLQFHAVDPAGGEVPLFRVRVTIDGKHGPLSDEVVSTLDLASMDDVPVGVPCRYRASAEERQSAWGTCSASQSSSPPIEVPLPKGWSTEVFVTDDRGQPLSGVRVVFDGELRGVTATDAPLRVALDHVPQSVFFELDGWKIVERGDYSAETGRFRSWQPFLTMRMEKR